MPDHFEKREELLAALDSIRILETSFWTDAHQLKVHYLLTNTPPEYPVAEEEFQLTRSELCNLLCGIRDYISNSEPKRNNQRKTIVQHGRSHAPATTHTTTPATTHTTTPVTTHTTTPQPIYN